MVGVRQVQQQRVVDAVLGAACAAAASALLWQLGGFAQPVAALAVLAAAACSPALIRTDLAERRLPNVITLPLAALGAAASALAAAHGAWGAALTALGVGALLVLLAFGGGMGMGDVKLGAALAFATAPFAWWAPIAGLAAAFVLGGIVGVVWLLRGERSLPFGPWLIAGSAAALVLVSVQ